MKHPKTFIHLKKHKDLVDSTNFWLSVIGHYRRQQNIVHVPNGRGEYLIVLFYDPVNLSSARRNNELSPSNTLMIYEPDDPRYYGNTEKPWSHSWFRCGGSELNAMIREIQFPLRVPLTLPNPDIFDKYLHEMDREFMQQSEPSMTLLRNLMYNCLFELKRSLDYQDQDEPVPASFLELKMFIDLNFARKITLDELVQRIHLSPQYLCKKFKGYFGCTPIEYAIRLKMQLAATLLKDHNMQIKAVAYEVGITDTFYFSKLFKKHFGTGPRQYRKASNNFEVL